jgi:hypothetical protein
MRRLRKELFVVFPSFYGVKINYDSRKRRQPKFRQMGFSMKTEKGKIVAAIVVTAVVLGIMSSCATGGGGSNSNGSVSSSNNTASTSNSNGSYTASAATERTIRGGAVPQFVKDAVKNTPENALVGIGTAKLASISQSRTISGTRGRADLARQLDALIKDMVRDYQASSEVDPSSALAFQETITVSLSQSRLQGASVVDEDIDDAGNYWTVVMLSKSDVAKEINQATAAAKLKVPAAASFDAEARMNAAFDAVKNDVQVASN